MFFVAFVIFFLCISLFFYTLYLYRLAGCVSHFCWDQSTGHLTTHIAISLTLTPRSGGKFMLKHKCTADVENTHLYIGGVC